MLVSRRAFRDSQEGEKNSLLLSSLKLSVIHNISFSPGFSNSPFTDFPRNSQISDLQFRFRGMKGVLSVDPQLDEIAAWAKANAIPDPVSIAGEETSCWKINCAFRPSQIK